MTNEASQTDIANPSPPAAPAPQPAGPMITPEIQALIDAAKSSAYNAGAKDARTSIEAKLRGQVPPAAPPPTTPAAPSTPTTAVDHRALRSFDRAMRRFDLTDEALAIVEEDFARANPSDPTAWVTARATAYGWRQLGAATSSTPVPTPASPPQPITAPPGAPVTDRSPPPPPYVVTDSTPLLQMKPHDREAVLAKYIAEHGVQKGNEKYADRFMDELKRDNVRVGPRR